MLALVSEFNCFLRSRCSMEMWCPDDMGRDSWEWVGPPTWERACLNSPEWRGGSSPVKTEPLQIGLQLLRLIILKEKLLLKGLTFAKCCSSMSIGNLYVFHVQSKLTLFQGKTMRPQNGLLIFSGKSSKISFKKQQQRQTLEIVKDF